jgi:outer membrane protein assembly factor BamB
MRTASILALVIVLAPLAAHGQSGSSTMIAPETLQRAGLERMWFTQLSLDRGRGRVAGIFQHVSPTQSHTVFSVEHQGKRYVFSERDRDAFGKQIGREAAEELAKKKAEELVASPAGSEAAAAPSVAAHVIPRITLYATSERGLVHAIDAETGRTLWTTQVGNPLYPTSGPAANDDFVGVCNGSTIYVLTAADGNIKWTRPTVGIPGAGPVLTHNHLFIPMVSGHMESLRLDEPKRPPVIYKSFGRIMTQPVVSENSVAWTTDSGNLYVGVAHGAGIRYRMQAGDSVAAQPAFLAPDKVLVASLDGYLYCVQEQKGNILWRFTTGESIAHPPVTLGEQVFVISTRGNMFSLDAATAAERWVAPGIHSYLAASDQRLYCQDLRGGLAILDAETGSRLATVPGIVSDLPLMNIQTDRLVLVSGTGMVQCFREAQRPFPLVHFVIEQPTQAARPAPRTATPKTDDTQPQPAATDPFDAAPARPAAPPPPAGDDPFGAPPAAAPPPPAGDPFGTP